MQEYHWVKGCCKKTRVLILHLLTYENEKIGAKSRIKCDLSENFNFPSSFSICKLYLETVQTNLTNFWRGKMKMTLIQILFLNISMFALMSPRALRVDVFKQYSNLYKQNCILFRPLSGKLRLLKILSNIAGKLTVPVFKKW